MNWGQNTCLFAPSLGPHPAHWMGSPLAGHKGWTEVGTVGRSQRPSPLGSMWVEEGASAERDVQEVGTEGRVQGAEAQGGPH